MLDDVKVLEAPEHINCTTVIMAEASGSIEHPR
jgi:hypothetical protein